MKINLKKHAVLLILALVFSAPGILALWVYQHPQWIAAQSTNKGKLVESNEALPFPAAKASWRLVLWQPGECLDDCLNTLDKLGRIRLALGRRLYDVEEWLLTEQSKEALPHQLLANSQRFDVKILTLSAPHSLQTLSPQKTIYIFNAKGKPVLAYKTTAEPKDIFHDLRHLLSTNDQ